MIILVDLDGVVYDLHTEWFRRYNERTGDNLTPEMVRSWGTHKYAKYGEAVYIDLLTPGVWFNGPIIHGAYKGIEELLQNGHEIYFVSCPVWDAPKCAYEKGQWVERIFPTIGADRVILAKEKHLVKGDVMVDDLYTNLEKFDGYKILFSQPWNEHIDTKSNGMIRAMNWQDVVEMVSVFKALHNYRSCKNDNFKEVRDSKLHSGASNM